MANRIAFLYCAGVLAVPAFVLAAIPPDVAKELPPSGGNPTRVNVTCYAPGADPTVEGPFATSKPNREGQNIPRTLDDLRLGRSEYVTLAANPAHYTKWFNLGTITYVSILDGRQYTLTNVVGYVHDTGGAFRSPGCQRWNTCGEYMRKFDIAYGDFRNGGNVNLVNTQPFCRKVETTWLQIGGPVTQVGVTDNGPSGIPVSGPRSSLVGTPTPVGSPAQSAYRQPADYSNYQSPSNTQPGQYFQPGNTLPGTSPIALPGSPIFQSSSTADYLLNLITNTPGRIPTTTPFRVVIDRTTGVLATSTSQDTIIVTPLTSTRPSQTFSPQTQNPIIVTGPATQTIAAIVTQLQSIFARIREILGVSGSAR